MTASPRLTMDLPERIRTIASADPERIALIHVSRSLLGRKRTRTTTFGKLSDRAEGIAVGLREIGVAEGSLCSFMVPPGEDAMVLALALWRVGAVMVGIEPHSHGLRKITPSLDRVGPEVFFGTPEAQLARRVFGWGGPTVRTNVVVGGPRLPGTMTLASLERTVPERPTVPAVTADDPALIAFTTGSTGSPKPTVMTQRNLTAMMDGVRAQWQLDADGDVIDMPTFPMFWIIGLSHGGTVVVPPMNFATKGPGQANPARLVATIREHRVSSMFASPALLTNLADHCKDRGIRLPTIRRIVSGGAEIQGPLYAAMKETLVNGELFSNYGATEALPVAEIDGATVLAETWPRSETGAGVCVGTPLAGVETRVIEIDDDPIATIGDARILNPGEIGEIIVRSPHISDHYFQSEQDMVENKIRDGETLWHRLGDCGFLDEQGRLWVCGRRSHRVVTSNGTLFPLCCEPVFNTHPDVARSALIGPRASAHGQPRPIMSVELLPRARSRRDQIAKELLELASRYPATRGIEAVTFVRRLPLDRRHNAKIDRPALAARLSAPSLR